MRSVTSRSRPCGCRYILAGKSWWQVVACPDHRMAFAPLAINALPGDAE